MDRNFFLALALAMMVAVGYQSIFVVPQKVKALENSQVAAVEEDKEIKASSSLASVKSDEPSTASSIKEEKSAVKTTNMELNLSNVGGSLHSVDIAQKKHPFLVEDILTVKGFEKERFEIVAQTTNMVKYGYSDNDWKIFKEYSLSDKNSLKAKISVARSSGVSRLEDIKITALNINGEKVDPADGRNTMLDEVAILENKKIVRIGNAFKFNNKQNKTVSAKIGWVAFRDHYHAFIVKPEFETKSYENEVVSEKQLKVNLIPKDQPTAGHVNTYEFTIVVGNQDINWLKSYNKGLEDVVAFSGFAPIDWLAKAVYHTVPFLHMICRSWGLSIILVSLLIYGITYPLTMKSMASMRKMQLVQPKMAALQAKYKKDPQKLNAEMIDLYKREGVNPLGGCLPFLLQMPVFMALYQILWRAYYFQGESFLWMKDLALPDRLFIMPFSLPFLGNEFNILPIVMALVMYVQQSISAKNMVITDEQQAMQQKLMKYIFPFFIGFIFYKFASGLSLYFTVFYALSAWTQWKVVSKTAPAPAK